MTTDIVEVEEIAEAGPNRDVPLSDHEAEALGHLAVALGGITTTIRSVAFKHALNSSHALQPLEWAEDALTDYDSLARATSRGRKQPKGTEDADKGDLLAREAAAQISKVVETLSFALELIAKGAPVASIDYVRQVVMADSQLTELLRLIPDADYTSALKQIWGRDAMPLRLR